MNALGTAATAMRAKLGESRSSIQRLSRPLQQATTGSLEALQNYSTGRPCRSRADSWRRFLCLSAPSRSIRISPWRYHYLATAFNNAGDTEREAELEEGLLR